MTNSNSEVVRQYLAALESFAHGEALAPFFTEDVVMHELPNRLVPAGQVRHLAELSVASAQAPKVLAEQKYAVRQVLEVGDRVVVDADWSATLKVPFGQTPVGGQLRARIAMFMRFREGRICEQTNFDCYEPF